MTLTRHTPLGFFILLMAMLLACLMMSGGADAGPYDAFETRPGESITNTAQVTWGDPDADIPPIEVEDTLTLVPLDTPGALRVYKYDPAGTPFNIAETFYSTGDADGPFAPSGPPGDNAPASGAAPLTETDRIRRGTPLYLLLDDFSLNFDSAARETAVLRLEDSITGDVEFLRLTETGPDTGVFAGYTRTTDGAATPGDGAISTRPNSRIESRYTDPWRSNRIFIAGVVVGPVDPFGVIFDSRSGQPVDGVQITLIDTDTGLPADVFGEDLSSSYPSTITTGSTVTDSSGRSYALDAGEYRFPFIAPGNYRFELTPPTGYTAPSTVDDSDIQMLPGAPFMLDAGSRLGAFPVTPGAPLEIDIPLDGSGILTVTRDGSADHLEIGDFIEYTVTARTNLSSDVVADIFDTLPRGLKILPDTLRVDGKSPGQPARITRGGRDLVVPGVTLPQGGRVTLTYVAQVVPGTAESDTLVSSTTARAGTMRANTAFHELRVTTAFGTETNTILGQVLAGGCDGAFDPERDLSGIRVMLADGNYAETDAEGLFTIRKVARGAHALALDPLSLPHGMTATLCENDTRKAGSAWSQFVEARGGLVSQVRFYLKSERTLDHPDDIAPPERESEDHDADWLADNADASGLVFPPQGYLPRGRSIDIVAARPASTRIEVRLNGDPVPGVHKRPAITAAGSTTRLDVWKGVSIPDGRSEITVITRSASGDVIDRETRQVAYNNTVSRMTLVKERSVLSSDGRTRPVVTLKVADSDGTPLHPGAMVNVVASPPFTFSSTDQSGDLVDAASTTGIVDPDGLLRLRLSPARAPGRVTFSTQGQDGPVETRALITLEDRPWVLVGIAEGTASHDAITGHMRDAQETALGELGAMSINGRAALTAQGIIRGKWLITARYDSALGERDADFFDLDPEADYIVYADRSREGDLAASRHPLYLRIAGPSGEFLYGDFDTALDVGQASYTRRLTGARAIFGSDAFRVMGFAAETSQSFAEERFAADGTTGPFDLSGTDILPFSERIVVEVTDRDLPSRVLSERALERGRDYDIDYRSGRIFLNDPLLSRDDQMNPRALIVSYEVDPENGDGWVVGARVEADLSDTLTLGATAVREDNVSGSDGAGALFGADMIWTPSEVLTLSGSVALSRQDASNTMPGSADGQAGDLRVLYDDGVTAAEAWVEARSTSFGIDNQDMDGDTLVGAGMRARTILSRSERQGEGDEADPVLHTRALEAAFAGERNLDTGEELATVEGGYAIENGDASLYYGLRGRRAVTAASEGETLKLVLGRGDTQADGRLRFAARQEIGVIRNGEIDDPDRGLLEVEWDATDRLTLRGTGEVAYGDDIRADIVSLGADYAAWKGATLSAGTLVASTRSSRQTVGFAGLAQDFEIDEATGLTLGVEHQGLLAGDTDSPTLEAGLSNPRIGESFTAWRAGFDHQAEDWSYGATAEFRQSDRSDQARLQALATRPLSGALDAGLKLSLFGENLSDGDFERDHELKASLAWRPRDRQVAVLEQLRGRYEEDAGHSELSLTNIVSYSRRLEDGHEINVRHGLKYATFGFDTGAEWDVTNYLGAEYRHNITETFDIGLHATSMHALRAGVAETSAGASIGVTPFDNGWISVGYNWTGYDSEDFQDGGATAEGVFVQFRIKIDSASISDLMR